MSRYCYFESYWKFSQLLIDVVLLDHRHVGKALKELMKNVEPSDDAEVSDNELEDMVCDFLLFSPCLRISDSFTQLVKAKEKQDKAYIESSKSTSKSAKSNAKGSAKGKSKRKTAGDEDEDEVDEDQDGVSEDSMMMDVDVDLDLDMDQGRVGKRKGGKGIDETDFEDEDDEGPPLRGKRGQAAAATKGKGKAAAPRKTAATKAKGGYMRDI